VRIGLALLGQETNTFNPTPTTYQDFEAFGILGGRPMLEELAGLGPVGGSIAAVETLADEFPSSNVELVPLMRAWSTAGGRISADAHRALGDRLDAALAAAGPLDGLALHLHGACAAEDEDDVDGALVERCRARLGPAIPIVSALDHHANVTARMMHGCTAVVGHRTQPHDPFETGMLATRLLVDVVAGRLAPTMAWRKVPLISHQEQFLTSEGPMKTWFDRARRLEHDYPGISVSTFPMQPWLDVAEAGWSAIAVTDGDRALADRIVGELAALAWELRDAFQVTTASPVVEAVRHADRDFSGLVVLSDTGDSVLGGSAGDSTVLLGAMLDLPIEHRALIPLVDPVAVASLHGRAEGDVVDISVGGAISGMFAPRAVRARIVRLAGGRVEVNDHSQRFVDMGRVAIVEHGPITLSCIDTSGSTPRTTGWSLSRRRATSSTSLRCPSRSCGSRRPARRNPTSPACPGRARPVTSIPSPPDRRLDE